MDNIAVHFAQCAVLFAPLVALSNQQVAKLHSFSSDIADAHLNGARGDSDDGARQAEWDKTSDYIPDVMVDLSAAALSCDAPFRKGLAVVEQEIVRGLPQATLGTSDYLLGSVERSVGLAEDVVDGGGVLAELREGGADDA